MAYDLLRIGPARDVPTIKPAWLAWAFLFVILTGGGALCVVRFWPAGEPTNTPWFWTCAVVFPILGWLIPFLAYLGVLQVPRQRAIDYNTARRDYLERVHRRARVPLHVLGSGFVFSVEPIDNTADAVVQKRLALAPRSRFPGDQEVVSARWIEPEGGVWLPAGDNTDDERHRELLKFLFDALLRQVAPALRAIPERTKMVVRLSIATQLSAPEIETIWSACWTACQLGPALKPEIATTAPELISADRWIDGKEAEIADAVVLLCVVQLNALLNTPPADGAAEAGVILMLAPAPLTARKRLASQALFFRPEQRDEKGLGQGVTQALLWGRVQGPELTDHWMTGGAESPLNRALAGHLDAVGVGVMKTPNLAGQHDIDLRLGVSGIAAPWLCLALALERAKISARTQLISISEAERLTVAVVAPQH
ncbi:hypothetical protein WT67_24980 [Burkholderia stagnalis]|uniref:Uncharacterized protein n=1 Tax=Burkholderia stagnalis TaxID=1503054 RepID=A0A6L3N2T8_9BURK|nr:hypothetical protein [Burkholderia stagnalis]KAB0640292.1 hypothetical protein F7R25_04470 [Burkholderia stagnalis]KVN04108.1 hypothetical protein WT07_10355 [Burkholderia stagnalis]KVN57176.1 hypothetical protein WT14_23105 [Burkholderia stagnalis]KVO39291.1 hypothetical protein WT17_20800 [Burkholderia stagnalis]KVO74535.1 hypothetical protein WT19_12140 [Burkholderia stagnalis]